MQYEWHETTQAVYRAIYLEHNGDFVVFESYTDMGHTGEKLEEQITAWGFKGSDHPLIKSELRQLGGWKYYILRKAYQDED